MMFPWAMTIAKAEGETREQFLSKLQDVANSGYELEDIVNMIPIEIQRIQKFDEFISDHLIARRTGQEWLDWQQASRDLHEIIA
jgi:hypothetical protein